MMLDATFQHFASNGAPVDHSVAASGITQTSLDPTGVFALFVVLRAEALALSPLSI